MNLQELLKKALKEAGLNEELANVITVTSEDQIEGIVKNLKPQEQGIDFAKIIGSKEFSDFVNSKGYDEVLKLSKVLQSGTDKKVTQGIKTYIGNLTPDDDDTKKLKNPNPNPNPNPNDPNAALLEALNALKEEVSGLKQKNERETKLGNAKKLMGESKLPDNLKEKWLNRINLDEDAAEQIKDLESEYEETYGVVHQSNSKRGLPPGGQTSTEVSDEEANEIAKEL